MKQHSLKDKVDNIQLDVVNQIETHCDMNS